MAFPCLRIPPSKESCAPPAGNPKTQEIRHPHPAFLQNRLLAQVKSQRSINRFRILHGRLATPRLGREGYDEVAELPATSHEPLSQSEQAWLPGARRKL